MLSQARIVQVDNWLYWLVSVVLVAIVPTLIWIFTAHWQSTGWLTDTFPDLPPETVLSPKKPTLVMGLSGLCLVPLLLAIARMRSLLNHYRQAQILTDGCARDIIRIGQWLTITAAIRLVLHTLEIMALSLDNPPGARVPKVALSSKKLAVFLIAGLLTVIGWALRDAAGIAGEHKGFI